MNLFKLNESYDELANNTSSKYNFWNFSSFDQYIDIDVAKWLIWLFTPVVV